MFGWVGMEMLNDWHWSMMNVNLHVEWLACSTVIDEYDDDNYH